MPGTDQNTNPASLTMDARKFLRAINTSAQSRIVFFEDSIKAMGQKAGKNFRLTSLDVNSLIFEDVDQNSYYHADLGKKSGGKIEISNIRPIKIVDEQKFESFEKHCADLVECLSRDDFKGADKAFRTIEVQRFRPSVIPSNGWVTTRDGAVHYITVEESYNAKFNIPAITEAFCEAVSEFVEMDDDGKVIRGEFPESGEKFDIPINEMTRRRLVAHHMKSVAEGAWRSDAFKKLVENVAGNISTGDVQRSVQLAAKFLKENQEFSLLTADETKSLIESTLASIGQFSSVLAEDVATLFYRTNLKVNKSDICESWEKAALKAENAELLHSAKLLESSNNFASEYDTFLNKVLNEGMDVQSARAKAYLTTLKVINSIIAKMEGKEDLANQVESMIAELEEPEPSTDIILEAEQLLCSIPDTLVDRIVTLENYSEIPGLEDGIASGAPSEPSGGAVSLPSKGGGGGGGGLGGALGGADMGGAPSGGPEGGPGVPGLEGGEEEGEEEKGKRTPPPGEEEEEGFPESKKQKSTVIEEMNLQQLTNELGHWKIDGHIYLAEDGFDDCNKQFARYIKRCEELDAAQLREQFESLRTVMIETGDDVIDDSIDSSDPYAGIEYGEDVKIDEAYGASMGKPSGHGVPTSGKAPSSPPSAKPASGDHKMGKPQGKGVASKDGGEASYSGGTGQKMDHAGGKGIQSKKLGDAGLPDDNEDDPDAGKPKTGGAQMGRPQGKGVAESVGDPEKVKPGVGKQYNSGGKFYGKLDAAIASELKSGDQDDKLTSAKHKAQKGGVAEGKGEVPEAFKKQWKRGKGEDGEKDSEEKGEGGEGGEKDGEEEKKPTTENVAAILHPYMEGKGMTAKAIAEAILKLKEAAKSNPKLKAALKIVEDYDWPREGPKRMKCSFCDAVGVGSEGDTCEVCEQGTLSHEAGVRAPSVVGAPVKINNILERISDDTGEDVIDLELKLKDDPWGFVQIYGEYMDEGEAAMVRQHGEDKFATSESQYKGPTTGMKPIGFKKSAITEWLTKEDVAAILTILRETEESEIQKLMAIKDPVQRHAAIRAAKEKLDLENPIQLPKGAGAHEAGEEQRQAEIWGNLGSAADRKAKREAAGLCTCPGRVVKNDRGQCINCKKPLEAEESMFDEAAEIIRRGLFEEAHPMASAHRQYVVGLLENIYNDKKANLQESMLAVFADDESIDKVIDAIVTTMDKKGELSPVAAIEPAMGAAMGAPDDEAPPLFGGPEEGPEGEADEAAEEAEEEAEEAEGAADEAEEEAEEEAGEATEED